MVLAVLTIGAATSLARELISFVLEALGQGRLRGTSLYSIMVIPAIHFAYLGYVRIVERRSAIELAGSGAIADCARGASIGCALVTGTIATIAALGYYRVEAVNPWTSLIPPLAVYLRAVYLEELLFRGVLFRIVNESLGTWVALLTPALAFGLVHVGNPNGTLFGGLAIAVESGVLLGAAYVLTGRLWLAMGIHFGWNFTQAIFGVNAFGRAMGTGSLTESVLSGPELVSGGGFGVDASIIQVAFFLTAGTIVVLRARQQARFSPPCWMRSG